MNPHKMKRRGGMGSVGRVLTVFLGLYLLLCLFFSLGSPLYVNSQGGLRRAACGSNLKQLGLALAQYSQDENGKMPPVTTATRPGWREAIYAYVKSPAVYHCPDDKREGYEDPKNLPKSYASNQAVLHGSFASASRTSIAAVDTRGYEDEDWSITSPAFLPSTGRELYAHHSVHWFFEYPTGKLICLFNDGHVKPLAPMATLTPLNLWTRDNAPFTGQDLANAQAILVHAANG